MYEYDKFQQVSYSAIPGTTLVPPIKIIRSKIIYIKINPPTLFSVQKTVISSVFCSLTSSLEFELEREGNLGTHSTRKLPATYARRNGCSRNDVDARGRWRSNQGMVDTYIDNTIPYPDAKVVAHLCVGGAINMFHMKILLKKFFSPLFVLI